MRSAMRSCVPVIPSVDHLDVVAATPHDHDVFDRRGRLAGLVDVRLEREHRAASVAAVGGDEHLGLGVVHPVGERL